MPEFAGYLALVGDRGDVTCQQEKVYAKAGSFAPGNGGTMTDEGYILDDSAEEVEGRRLELLCRIYDPPTQELIESKVSLSGAHVLEVGAGRGTIATWLADEVGSEGRVFATDTNIRFLAELERPNLQVDEHNVVTDEITSGPFDLVHCRFLLEHIFQQAPAVIDRMIGALKPGGWLIIEEADHGTNRAAVPDHPLSDRYNRTWDSVVQALADLGTNLPTFGRQVPPLLYESELLNVGSSGTYDVCAGGSEWAEMLRLAVVSLTAAADSIPGVDRDDLSSVQTALGDPSFYLGQMTAVRAWGQKR